jgi:hypothetical protein
VAIEQLVEGPFWVASGLDESSGLYPLRVEQAVGRLVERLLPGVITTTTGARYYGLHTLAWSDAEERGLNDADADAFVRRCEVVVAAASLAHAQTADGHRRRVPAAHGEDRIPRFIDNGELDVAAAASAGGYSQGGFAGTYAAPDRTIGLLRGAWPPRRGPRADLTPLREGLGPVLQLAREPTLSAAALADSVPLCPCLAADSPDGQWLRRVIFEEAERDSETDRNRQITALMLLEALGDGPHADPEQTFRLSHGFGTPIEGDTLEASVRRAWRAAILRNYSVSAWRHLWRWLSEQLAGDALTARELADTLAGAVGSGRVDTLVADLPVRVDADGLLPVEEQLRATDEDVPTRALRQLALGAQRLQDLDAETRHAYLGRDRDDLGPSWVEHQLAEHADGALADLARELVDTMLRRARRVALSKMRLGDDLRPYVPTRLRDRDGLLSMVGTEADAEVSLRGWTLAQVLGGLGAIDRPGGAYAVSPQGAELRERLRTNVTRTA